MAHLECLVQENEVDTESWPYDVVSGQASNSELFFSALGGHGQFLANLVRWIRLVYTEFDAFTSHVKSQVTLDHGDDSFDYDHGSLRKRITPRRGEFETLHIFGYD
ncbi:hypothetical protein ACLB2K_064577 [Fragaria x ananassa]